MISQPTTRHLLQIPGYRQCQQTQGIIRLEGDGNYTHIHMSTQSHPLLASKTLKYFEGQLTGFIRISKASLINPGYIDRFIKEGAKNLSLQLTNGVLIRVSRRRMATTLRRLGLKPSLSEAFSTGKPNEGRQDLVPV
jgi:two-component system LytT family response regulator